MVSSSGLEKGLRIVSPPHFEYNFSKKKYLSDLLTQHILLSDCLYFLIF